MTHDDRMTPRVCRSPGGARIGVGGRSPTDTDRLLRLLGPQPSLPGAPQTLRLLLPAAGLWPENSKPETRPATRGSGLR